jgi:tetratricopeptide (TPR) repeat protein
MNVDPILNKAALLAKKHDYKSALKILKDEEDRYFGSFKYYYLYGVICLYSGSFVEAHENFKLARKLKIKDSSTMLGLAVLYLKRLNTGQAVDYYLEVQELEPKNKIAKKALLIIRKYSAAQALSEWMTFERLSKLFPPIPSPAINPQKIIKAALVFTLTFAITYAILAGFRVFPNPFARNVRPAADFVLSSEDRREPVQIDGLYRYILTRDQAVSLYDRAFSLFTSYRDEAAKINLNRILESNASAALKNRARLLLDNMEVPGFDNFKRGDNPSFSDVRNEPFIYRNVHVIWRGMATNLEITDEYTRFYFLVGYDTRRVLEGIVPVVFSIPVAVNTERPLEVLGRIILTGDSSRDIMLEGVSIHQSGRLEH